MIADAELDPRTAHFHAVVHALALKWLDELDVLDPAEIERRRAQYEAKFAPGADAAGAALLEAHAMADALIDGKATVARGTEGRENAIANAVAQLLMIGPGRPPMQGCRHGPRPGDPGTIALVALRAFGCGPCMLKLAFVHAAELRVDRACDGCGVDRDLLTPITFTYAGTVIQCHLCGDCASLFRYVEDLPTTWKTTITRVGRNDRCFCGSDKKYKRCHGRAA